MNTYGKDNLPKLDQPTDKKYYFNSTQTYKAADVTPTETTVKNEFNTLKSDIETALTNFNKHLEQLESSFGTKFIAINNQPLGFVDIEAFNTLTKTITTSLESSEENINTFFSTCQTKTEEINNWLKELNTNYNILKQYEKLYYHCVNSDNEEYQAQASTYRNLMSEYEQLPGDPLNYGDWIKE